MGFLANPANRTVETSSKTHGLLRAPSPNFRHMNHVQHQLTQGDDAQLLIFQEVCLAAVRQNGRALRHASETQRNNKEVVDAALENCTEAQL